MNSKLVAIIPFLLKFAKDILKSILNGRRNYKDKAGIKKIDEAFSENKTPEEKAKELSDVFNKKMH